MDRAWIRERNFSSLSITDLLDAREAYHVHLAHLDNVFATAIGRYLIRRNDAEATNPEGKRSHSDVPRTLKNTVVRKWSWPCVLVFVDQWTKRSAFAKAPDTMVPRYLYLPDGRVIPTCVVEASRSEPPPSDVPPPIFPSDLMGGGYPALQEVQGQRRMSSMGCLVTDGDQTYMLTNRHVAGEAGRKVHSVVAGRRQPVGESAGRELGKRPFAEVYKGWPGSRVMLNIDAGLVRLDDVSHWTAQVYGVGQLGPIKDLHVDSFSLDLIDCPVRAFGAAGGPLEGQIQALFFRYKSVGGVDYVSDFLIGPRQGRPGVGTRPGDSGTVWFEDIAVKVEDGAVDRAPAFRPFALQWGGQTLSSPGGGEGADYALASCLSTICRELDVDIISDWNVGHPETWGPVGHFKVGALACELVSDSWLKKLFMLNQRNIGHTDSDLVVPGKLKHPSGSFVPLADVADFVWRNIRQIDDNNHFADIDHEAGGNAGEFSGKSLLELTKGHPERVSPDYWNRFYSAIEENKRGALPFRVWQIYDEMVDFAAAGDLVSFVCAAGLMAHYVGDACQPLHVSELHHGHSKAEAGVHSAYETSMLNQFTDELLAAIGSAKSGWPSVPVVDGTGQAAAAAVVELMRRTVKRLPPAKVVDTYNDNPGRGRGQAMWDKLGDDTAACIFDGSITLARIWQGAWRKGRAGKANPKLPTQPCSQTALKALYMKATFLPSAKLQDLREKNGRLIIQ